MLKWYLWNMPGNGPHKDTHPNADSRKAQPTPAANSGGGNNTAPASESGGQLHGNAVAPASDGWGPYQPILAITGDARQGHTEAIPGKLCLSKNMAFYSKGGGEHHI